MLLLQDVQITDVDIAVKKREEITKETNLKVKENVEKAQERRKTDYKKKK